MVYCKAPEENSSQLSALAGGRVDKKWEDSGYLDFPDQNGETSFQYHFALTSHQTGFDAISSMKFSLEHQNPLVTGEVSGGKSASKQNQFSLLSVSDPNVLLWSVKPSEEGMENGLITRFWNMGSSNSNPEITLSQNIGSAWQTTHIETNENQLKPLNDKLSVSFNPYQIKTFRLLPETK